MSSSGGPVRREMQRRVRTGKQSNCHIKWDDDGGLRLSFYWLHRLVSFCTVWGANKRLLYTWIAWLIDTSITCRKRHMKWKSYTLNVWSKLSWRPIGDEKKLECQHCKISRRDCYYESIHRRDGSDTPNAFHFSADYVWLDTPTEGTSKPPAQCRILIMLTTTIVKFVHEVSTNAGEIESQKTTQAFATPSEPVVSEECATDQPESLISNQRSSNLAVNASRYIGLHGPHASIVGPLWLISAVNDHVFHRSY